ncbi:MAG: glycosyltransferase [Candidatus Omnitrophota bacterium]
MIKDQKVQVSVIVVCYNEIRNIADCLQSLASMDFPKEDYEILCVDSLSTDGTREVIRDFMAHHSNIRLADNPEKSIPKSRNIGVRASRFPYVAFTDADCVVPPNWLTRLVRGFDTLKNSTPELAALGGTNRAPSGKTRFYDATNIIMKTMLGNRGSTQGKEFDRDLEVDHMPTLNILYEKSAIDAAGGFDEAFQFVCEDPDLNYRLTQAGRKIYYLTGAEVVHVFKPGFQMWAERSFRYGWGRIQLLTKHPDHVTAVYFVPPMIVLLTLLPFFAGISSAFLWPVAAYGLMILAYSVFYCLRQRRPDLLFHVILLYFITHFSFGLGEIWGILGRSSHRANKQGSVK